MSKIHKPKRIKKVDQTDEAKLEIDKMTLEYVKEHRKDIPRNILKQVYDTDDNVLFGSKMVKGKVSYSYIPKEYMTTDRPFYLFCSISYDGKGNSEGLPEDAVIISFNEVEAMFPDNHPD